MPQQTHSGRIISKLLLINGIIHTHTHTLCIETAFTEQINSLLYATPRLQAAAPIAPLPSSPPSPRHPSPSSHGSSIRRRAICRAIAYEWLPSHCNGRFVNVPPDRHVFPASAVARVAYACAFSGQPRWRSTTTAFLMHTRFGIYGRARVAPEAEAEAAWQPLSNGMRKIPLTHDCRGRADCHCGATIDVAH